jgi:hypothetical protein
VDGKPAAPDFAEVAAAAVEDSDEEESGARGAENRQYIKDLLISHPIWRDGNYWEQTLWQCAIEQVRGLCDAVVTRNIAATVCSLKCMQRSSLYACIRAIEI